MLASPRPSPPDSWRAHPGGPCARPGSPEPTAKTTTALLLRELLGRKAPAAAIGTLGVVGPDGRVQQGTEGLTTPGPVQLTGRLSALARSGVADVVLESSSHALDQFRLDGIRFDVTAFTNLTRNHLDYHGSHERYLAAKARLIELGKEGATAVINADDPAWGALRPPGPVIAYGLRPGTVLRAAQVRLTSRGSSFVLVWSGQRRRVALPLPGGFNVSNALCAAGWRAGPGPVARRSRGPGWARQPPSRAGWSSWWGSRFRS